MMKIHKYLSCYACEEKIDGLNVPFIEDLGDIWCTKCYTNLLRRAIKIEIKAIRNIRQGKTNLVHNIDLETKHVEDCKNRIRKYLFNINKLYVYRVIYERPTIYKKED